MGSGVRFEGRSWILGSTLRVVLAFFALNAFASVLGDAVTRWMSPIPVSFLGVLAFALFAAKQTTILVGEDGVVRAWLFGTRFISFREIRDVETSTHDVVLRLTSGAAFVLPMHIRRGIVPETEQRDALFAAVQEGVAAYRARTEVPLTEEALARGARDVATWVLALRSLGEQKGYREVNVRDEDLWRVVEDARAPEATRAAAVVALRSSLRADGQQRLRVAADNCLSPKLRVALTTVGAKETDERELMDTLGDLERTTRTR